MKGKLMILGFLLIVSFVSLAFAADLPDYEDKYVNDFASVLTTSQVDSMRGLLTGIDRDTTAEIVFVSDSECSSKGGPSQYAFDLFSKWKVGKADKDNGLLILYCLEENKIWVTTGYGLEGILPDSKIGRMLDENYVPLRDEGNVSQGIVNFVEQVSNVIVDNKEEVLSGQAGGDNLEVNYWPFVIWIVIIILIAISRARNAKKSGRRMSGLWWIPLFLPGRGFGGGGGGFGGGGFGGGMSGGGGAGR